MYEYTINDGRCLDLRIKLELYDFYYEFDTGI